jgi:hypothetical protein
MDNQMHSEIQALMLALDEAQQGVLTLVRELAEADATKRDRDSWSIAQCLDHIAKTNQVYLAAMQPAAEGALEKGRSRRRPARPGWLGRWFVQTQEPPVGRFKVKAPAIVRPSDQPSLATALQKFEKSQDAIRDFIDRFRDIDLAGVSFRNPFVRGLRLSLATGLHVLLAHERRHLWQAWRIRAEVQTRPSSGDNQAVSREANAGDRNIMAS